MAFVSSARAMEMNDQFFRATQAARVSVTRITTQVRDAMVDPDPTYSNTTSLYAGRDFTKAANRATSSARRTSQTSTPGAA